MVKVLQLLHILYPPPQNIFVNICNQVCQKDVNFGSFIVHKKNMVYLVENNHIIATIVGVFYEVIIYYVKCCASRF